jgi:phage shock protein PspC (stress-responsive transcriptional regulator)
MKKFYRSTKNKKLTGVCGGLGYHTHTDPLLWRLLFVVVPSSILFYIAITLLTDKK